MDNGENEFGINEEKARDLVYYLLENDASIFKKLIPEIKDMDSESFANLFKGTPFKGKNNIDEYNYNVRNKKQFENLLDKFDNFWIILDEWYLDKKYYEYIKDLWSNYISIEKLKKLNNENRIESFLNSYDIDYKNWPKSIKDDFKKKSRATKNTRILDPQKEKEFEKQRSELKKLLKQLNYFKKKTEQKPEMKIYVENTDKLMEKLKKGLNYLKYFAKGKGGLGTIISTVAIPIIGGAESVDPNCCKENIENNSYLSNLFNDSYDEIDLSYDDENYGDDVQKNSLEKADLESLKNIFDNNLFFSAYIISSFLLLGWSIYDFYQAYNDLITVKQNIPIFEEDLKKIKSDFKQHKEKIGILPDDFKESLENIKEVFELICQDYDKLEDLINKINENIEIANKHKKNSTLGLIGHGILGIAGITGGILLKNGKAIAYGIGAFANIASAAGHSAVIIESTKLIKDLKRIKEDAIIQKKQIKDEIDNLSLELSNMEKGQLPNYEKNIIENYF